jgi:hypothetical protein
MTTEKQQQKQKQIPFGNDSQKSNGRPTYQQINLA